MAERDGEGDRGGGGLGHNPLLDDAAIFSELFAGGTFPAREELGGPSGPRGPLSPTGRTRPAKPRPEHYRIVSFSLYLEDIARLEELVRRLKQKGYTKANKSQVIRYALAMVDIDKMPVVY